MTLKKQWNWNLGCSLLLVGVLASVFLFYLWAQNLGKYTLQPAVDQPNGQSSDTGCGILFRVNSKEK